MSPTCLDMSARHDVSLQFWPDGSVSPTRHWRWLWHFVLAWADIYQIFESAFVEIYYGMGVHMHRNFCPNMLSTLISWFCCFHQDHFLSGWHYNNVAKIMSSVCDWAHFDLCQKPQGPASLIKCMEDGCNGLLHHMCQCIWESDDEEVWPRASISIMHVKSTHCCDAAEFICCNSTWRETPMWFFIFKFK